MGFIHFLLGFVLGIVIFRIYLISKMESWKAKFENKNRIFQLVENSKDVIYYYEVKPKFKHRYTSPSVEYFLGEGTLEELDNNPQAPFEMIHPDDYEIMLNKVSSNIDYSKPIIQRLQDKQGNYKWFEEYTTPIYENGELIAVQGIMRNIDDKIKLQQSLEYRITHDALTNIYNREFFEQSMEKYNKHIDASVGILLCDLDDLKYLNDHYGHKKGDILLQEFAKLLNQYFSGNAIVSRIGGDEFVIIIINTDKTHVESLCENLSQKISEYNRSSEDLKINMSMGHAFSKQSIGKMESLFAEADKKMYQNKREKKGQYLMQASR
ncbi:sensor domain-containing diguanylate cyclase [Bacillus sp. FJAT-42315]|uniref:sensor domain-containing diguanylate cyclase n=1 Tax=Bacillus sp. FJAT-42315 TaxID=2014077 RepID=UPI000C2425E0|nr:sensor domain-containing diguanylate cyclase [Bacillus sp. FJAT-42315]